MGDYLPISMFFNEIWVKNRPFSCFDKKNIIYLHLAKKGEIWHQIIG